MMKRNESAKQTAVKDINLLMQKAVFELSNKVIEKTPVDEGRARANWQVNFSPIKNSFVKTDKTGASTITKILAKMGSFDIEKHRFIFISNNLPYINMLEFGGYTSDLIGIEGLGGSLGTSKGKNVVKITPQGYSKQAPQGMLRLSIKELKQEMPSIIRQVK